MQNNSSNTPAVYAGFWVRLAAYLIDSILVFAGLLVVRLVMNGVMAILEETWLGGNILFSFTLKDIVLYLCGASYFVLCTYFTGTTAGKKLMNLRVVSADGKSELTFFNVLYRETIGRFLSGFIVNVGYLMIGIDKEKRGLHDVFADTRVVYGTRIKVYPVYQKPVYQGSANPVPQMNPAPPMRGASRPMPPVNEAGRPMPPMNEADRPVSPSDKRIHQAEQPKTDENREGKTEHDKAGL